MAKKRKNGQNGIWQFGSPGDPNAMSTFNKNVNFNAAGGNACGMGEEYEDDDFSNFDALKELTEGEELDEASHKYKFKQGQRDKFKKLRLNNTDKPSKESQDFIQNMLAEKKNKFSWEECYLSILKERNKKDNTVVMNWERLPKATKKKKILDEFLKLDIYTVDAIITLSPDINDYYIDEWKKRYYQELRQEYSRNQHDKLKKAGDSSLRRGAKANMNALSNYVDKATNGWKATKRELQI